MLAALLTLGVVMGFIFGGGILIVGFGLCVLLIVTFFIEPSQTGFMWALLGAVVIALFFYILSYNPTKKPSSEKILDDFIKERREKFWITQSKYILNNFYDLDVAEKNIVYDYWANETNKNRYADWEDKFYPPIGKKVIDKENYYKYQNEIREKLANAESQIPKLHGYHIEDLKIKNMIADTIYRDPTLDWEDIYSRQLNDSSQNYLKKINQYKTKRV